ncbi:hypothetical protein ACTFIU_000087 [Dictyostelium citrinum]
MTFNKRIQGRHNHGIIIFTHSVSAIGALSNNTLSSYVGQSAGSHMVSKNNFAAEKSLCTLLKLRWISLFTTYYTGILKIPLDIYNMSTSANNNPEASNSSSASTNSDTSKERIDL